MFIKQLSIFVENKVGRLQSIIDALGENDVNISALSIADTTDFGILRIIVDNPDKAKLVLKGMGVISKTTDVIAVYIDDRTGGLASVLEIVSKAGIGYLIVYGGQVFKLDLVMCAVFILCVLAAIMYAAVALLERLVIKNRK